MNPLKPTNPADERRETLTAFAQVEATDPLLEAIFRLIAQAKAQAIETACLPGMEGTPQQVQACGGRYWLTSLEAEIVKTFKQAHESGKTPAKQAEEATKPRKGKGRSYGS